MKKVHKPLGNRYISAPTTIGEHLCNRRVELGMLQREVAKEIGISEDCVRLWELGRSFPSVSYMPQIILFIGFNPVEIDLSTLGGKIYAFRIEHGLSHKRIGQLVGVNASTIGAWEKGRHQPNSQQLKRLNKVLYTSGVE